jgi:1-acyl-sn-glycerol-3-phosphate acyltransferase
MKTIYTTPVLREFLSIIARLFLRLAGWKVVGETPQYKKYILIAAPHTSNWDFIFMLLVVLSRKMDARWMGKQQLFKPPFRGFMKWLGGIAIERSKANNTVDTMVSTFQSAPNLTLLITPEGTRSKVKEWKTGFYRIATAAEIPIVLGFIDASTKTCGFGDTFNSTGNITEDMITIKANYQDKTGICD